MLSLPGSINQVFAPFSLLLFKHVLQLWHSDGPPASEKVHLPPYALNVFVPLVNLTTENGPTQFAPGSHLLGNFNTPVGFANWLMNTRFVQIDSVSPTPKAGHCLLFDYRLRHRGLSACPLHFSWALTAHAFQATRAARPGRWFTSPTVCLAQSTLTRSTSARDAIGSCHRC